MVAERAAWRLLGGLFAFPDDGSIAESARCVLGHSGAVLGDLSQPQVISCNSWDSRLTIRAIGRIVWHGTNERPLWSLIRWHSDEDLAAFTISLKLRLR